MVKYSSLNQNKWVNFQLEDSAYDFGTSQTHPIVQTIGGIYRAALPTYVDGDAAILHFTTDGKLMVDTELTLDGNIIVNNLGGAAAHDVAIAGNPLQMGAEAATFDGAALPHTVNAEGDVHYPKCSLTGVLFTMPVTQDGASTPIATHDTAIGIAGGNVGFMGMMEAKEFDGLALPNVVTEADAVRPAASLYGVQYSMLVSEDGSKTVHAVDDSAQVATPDIINVGGEYRAAATVYTDGDATILQTDINGNLKVTQINTEYTDDSAGFTVAASKGNAVMAIATADSVDVGDIGALRMTVARNLGIDVTTKDGAAWAVGNAINVTIGDGTTVPTVNPGFVATEAIATPSLFTTAGMYGTDLANAAPTLLAAQVAVDNTTVGAIPNVLEVGGIYKNALDTYDDNDAVPFHFDSNGRLITAVELNDYVDDTAFTVATDKMLVIGGIATADAVDAGDAGAFRMTVSRNLGIDITEQTLTAMKVSATAAANTAANPIFTQLGNGTNVLTCHDGSITAIDDVNTNDGVQVHSLLYGYDDTGGASTWRGLAVNASGAVEVAESTKPAVTNATGALAISTTTAIANHFRLVAVTCHFSAAPATSENFTVTLDANDGVAYDTVLFSVNPSATSATDVVYIPDKELLFESGDEIVVAFANTNLNTYGLRIVTQII